MDVVHECCAGLDVHKKTVVACVLRSGPGGVVVKKTQTFSTLTTHLAALADWLAGEGCTHVALEATGVYWKPVYNLLEDRFTVLVVNPEHIKALAGRKTDRKDAERLAQLLRYDLLTGSFIPNRAQRELRELTRARTALIRERARVVQRLEKTLEGANIKLASVATDIMGASGRQMLAALVDGRTDGAALAQLAKGRMRPKLADLERALTGRMGAHQRFLLAEHLGHSDELTARIERISAAIGERLRPFEDAIVRLDTIPGVGRRTAEVLVAEIGSDLSRFRTAAQLASWAGMCPGNHESAGKRKSGKTRTGSPWLRAALVEAAHGASRARNTYLMALYRRLAARRGRKKALVAVGHTILVIAYHLLTRQTDYQDLGAQYFDIRDRLAVERRLVRRLEALGYKVSLDPVAA
jgi:transposase